MFAYQTKPPHNVSNLVVVVVDLFWDFLRHSWGLSANNAQVIIYLGRRHDVTVHTLHRWPITVIGEAAPWKIAINLIKF